MNAREKSVADALLAVIERLDHVLVPWGFQFASDQICDSHCGPYASGHYCRGATRIGLSCRAMVDNLYYQHRFIEENICSRKIEQFTMNHGMLMRALGHFHDSRLKCVDQKIPDCIEARNGGDRVTALIDDLTSIAAPILQKPCDEFCAIIRTGWRGFSVENVD